MGKRVTTPLLLGGQFSAGNAASTPDGYVRALNNYLTRPGRLPARPPFMYDSLMSINGLANFDDITNRVRRLLAINTSQQVFEKAASGETWGGANATTVSGTRLTDAADYRGITVMMFDDGAGLPSGAASFDGTNISTSPFSSPIQSRGIVTFDERYYLIYPRVSVFNAFTGPFGSKVVAYDFTNGSWVLTNITAANFTSGGSTISRLFPASTTASSFLYQRTGVALVGALNITASDVNRSVVWRSDMRNTHPTFNMPITIEWLLMTLWAANASYVVGDMISDGTHIQRCTTAGTSGAVIPGAWGATVGATTADNTVTWTNEGSNIIGATEAFIPNATDQKEFSTFWVKATVPRATNTAFITIRCKFFNTSVATITLAPIDVSLKDGLADGDAQKQNRGQQITTGDFFFPFFNGESANTLVIDMDEVVWSEIGLPKVIRASNTYKLRESVGRPTAGTAIGGRLMVAKRNAIWQFQDTGDPDIPIRREKFMAGIGITGPRAHDKFEGEWFFVGENDCYRYKVGDEIPKPFCGDGMRETVMAKGANWVESQSTYKRPLLAIDQQQLIVWIYTQKGKLFAYDLRSGRWSTHYVAGNIEIDAMIWNPGTGNFYVSFGGHGLTRMDYTSVASDTTDNTATPLALDKSFVLPPLKISTLRFDAYCEGIKMLYASANPSLQSVTASISYDQGATYPNSVNYTPFLSSTFGDFVPITLDICESGPSITLKVAASGPGGEGSWSLAEELEMKLKINRGEFPRVNPTAGSSNL